VVDISGVKITAKLIFQVEAFKVPLNIFHHLLSGCDEGYSDLLINIFEHVLTCALGCCILNRRVLDLNVSVEEIGYLQNELSRYDDDAIAFRIKDAEVKLIEELNIEDISLKRYIEKSLLKIISNIIQAVRTNTLDKLFVCPADPDMKPKIHFSSGIRMDDGEYRKFIDELVTCRYSTDKIAFIRERAKSLGDIEDVLFDGELKENEIYIVFDMLGDIEIAYLYKKHPIKPDVEAVDLSEDEEKLRKYIDNYIAALDKKRQGQIFELSRQIVLD
jgi:hypothetical protein